MNRRETIIALVALGSVSLAVQAQRATRVPRIGYLSSNLTGSPNMTEGFRQGLRDLGYVEGRNVAIEIRDADGKLERLPVLAAELVALKVDVILTAGGTRAALAAKQATTTVPIVFGVVGDPIAEGLVTSLAHPSGNITGMTFLVGPEIAGKQLQILREVAPAASLSEKRSSIPRAGPSRIGNLTSAPIASPGFLSRPASRPATVSASLCPKASARL